MTRVISHKILLVILAIVLTLSLAVFALPVIPVAASSPASAIKLLASDAAANDYFGITVSIYGDTAIVGADAAGMESNGTGASYVFIRSGGTWRQQAELTANDAAIGDDFGASVSIYGDTVVVGAPLKRNGGAAYIFTRNGKTWNQQTKLIANEATAYFGTSVSIYGNTVVVGAYGTNNFTGATYVFVRNGKTWNQQAKLTADDAAVGDGFGIAVSNYGDTVVVGADGKNNLAGGAYVFTRNGKTWSQQANLTARDTTAGDFFGISVSNYDDTIMVGAPNKDTNTGAIYVFAPSGRTWSQKAKLTASDATVDSYFGISVCIYGEKAVVGSVYKDSVTSAAYVFAHSGRTWNQQAKLTASDATINDFFGRSVSIYDGTIVVGAPWRNNYTGVAYVYNIPQHK
jgi:hypothetical protein